MALTVYLHPLSSFCHKVLIALYENAVPFTPHLVDLSDPAAREEFKKVWPVGKFPVLRDEARSRVIPESTSIIEYLDRHYPGQVPLIPQDAEAAHEVRAVDRFYDLHIHDAMQRIVGDRLRPADARDPLGVEQAKERSRTALRLVDRQMAERTWAAGEHFSMADCAAAPALYYTNRIIPLAAEYPRVNAYLERLMMRPSYARTLREAEPYMADFPA